MISSRQQRTSSRKIIPEKENIYNLLEGIKEWGTTHKKNYFWPQRGRFFVLFFISLSLSLSFLLSVFGLMKSCIFMYRLLPFFQPFIILILCWLCWGSLFIFMTFFCSSSSGPYQKEEEISFFLMFLLKLYVKDVSFRWLFQWFTDLLIFNVIFSTASVSLFYLLLYVLQRDRLWTETPFKN